MSAEQKPRRMYCWTCVGVTGWWLRAHGESGGQLSPHTYECCRCGRMASHPPVEPLRVISAPA